MTLLTSPKGNLRLGAAHPTVLINDQLRIMDQSPEIFAQLKEGNLEGLLALARWGQESGTDMVDVLINHPDLDEAELLPRIVQRIKDEVGCPISLDSRNPKALDAALQALRPYKAIINSVTAEQDSLETLLPLAKKHNAAVIGMPVGHIHGLPKTVEGRLAEANVILQACKAAGIPREDVVMDAICLVSAAEPLSFQVTMETLKAFRDELQVTTTLGIGNAGFGMPDQTVVDLAYLIAGISWGLDSALVNPATRGLVETVRAMDFLAGRDPAGRLYIQNYRKTKRLKKE
jgi:5-methyltetrahydrofolate--homocysteine methyltransferase